MCYECPFPTQSGLKCHQLIKFSSTNEFKTTNRIVEMDSSKILKLMLPFSPAANTKPTLPESTTPVPANSPTASPLRNVLLSVKV